MRVSTEEGGREGWVEGWVTRQIGWSGLWSWARDGKNTQVWRLAEVWCNRVDEMGRGRQETKYRPTLRIQRR